MSAPLDWVIPTDNGFWLEAGGFHLDPKRAVARAVISHAHADHYPRLMGEVHAHPATIALAAARYKAGAGKVRVPHGFGEQFRLGDLEVSFLPAGHMLGSCQVLVHHPGRNETLLYSGDFALGENPTCEQLVYPGGQVDLLICESTFGKKEAHEHPEESLTKALADSARPLLIAAYALGKAQRVNELLGRVAPDLPVLVHRAILPFHNTYRQFGVDLGPFEMYKRRRGRDLARYAFLVPPRALTSYQNDYRYHKLFASGWNQKSKFHFLEGFLDISDHASASEIEGYIDKVSPGEVWFWHGYPQDLIAHCKARGIPARSV